ncbi:hypothetical protein F183_A31520 [Bryobacterales bacterium F-183]|nr:hypothetical protein F183_A31520 [Bryobacterales bacterium F-183]
MRKPDDNIQHLLGGYASGTLTPEEQQRLFEAAMEDQQLFDALANEQALKEILDDPDSRGYLRKALAESEPEPKRKASWWWPAAGISAVAVGLAVFLMVGIQQKTAQQPATEVAQNTTAPAPTQSPAAFPPKGGQELSAPPPPARATTQRKVAPPVAEAMEEAKPEKEAPQLTAAAPKPPPPPPPPAPAPASAHQPVTLASSGNNNNNNSGPSASILFLQPQAFGVPGATAATPTAAGAGESVFSRSRMAVTTTDRAKKAEAVAADAQALVPNAGIRYRIFRKNSQGDFVETRLDTRFEDGDEIQFLIEDNSSGRVTLLREVATNRWETLPFASQQGNQARSAPIRLERGSLRITMILSPNPAATLAAPPRQVANQLTEVRGNAMYVVAPGLTSGLVATDIRIAVN